MDSKNSALIAQHLANLAKQPGIKALPTGATLITGRRGEANFVVQKQEDGTLKRVEK